MLGQRTACFVHLGKFGDLIIMLPGFRQVALELGHPVICVVSREYASLFDGVSYVLPWVVDLHWWRGVREAGIMAEQAGFHPIIVKWWDAPNAKPPMVLDNGQRLTLRIHGRIRVVPAAEWDSYQGSQWRYAGFPTEAMFQWPLYFDLRDRQREAALCATWLRPGRRHLLVNMPSLGTSPFRFAGEVLAFCYGRGMDVINLGQVKAARIYDLLGLYDHSDLLVTSDTATLHLAAASNIPYIAFLNNGGAGSIPRGNCILAIRYGEFAQRRGQFQEALRVVSRYHETSVLDAAPA